MSKKKNTTKKHHEIYLFYKTTINPRYNLYVANFSY